MKTISFIFLTGSIVYILIFYISGSQPVGRDPQGGRLGFFGGSPVGEIRLGQIRLGQTSQVVRSDRDTPLPLTEMCRR